MKNLKTKNIFYIAIVIVVAIGIVVCICIDKNYTNENDYNEDIAIQNFIQESNKTEEKIKIYVHIAGEVINPGIIELYEGSRIKDLVELAGGFTENADINKINLAYQVEDGQKIIIPSTNQNLENPQDQNYTNQSNYEGFVISGNEKIKININTATQSELESLNGIGPSMAAKIIEYRKINGKFKKIEDIKNVTGIGESKFENIKNNICVK